MTHDPALERFEKLVAQYGHVIRSAVRSLAGAESDRFAGDVEQQVLLELWKQLQNEQTIHYPSSYLYKAAIRETIRLARRARQRPEEDLESVELVDSSPDTDPERRALSGELSKRLRKLTEALGVERRDAVRAHLAGYRVREIMDSQGWSYQRARNLIARGIADLRRALTETDT